MFPANQMETGRLVYSVSQLTREIKDVIEGTFPRIWIEGEVSNYNLHSSGHIYFDLKDSEAVIRCAFFRSANQGIKFSIKDGLKVLCFGRIGVYEKKGQYQLYAEKVEPKGAGELWLAFERLKELLKKEGLFDASRKIPVPVLPSKIGIVTSPTGAAIRDILNILKRRFDNIEILIYPVKVQGDGAAEEIAAAIAELNRMKGIDVLILARGGGSLEDIWAFNEEIVARAIYKSVIPVISAIGHEVDWTISDFVADLRAPTPSAAAELVIARKEDISEKIDASLKRMKISLRNLISTLDGRLEGAFSSPVFKYPLEIIERYSQELDDLLKVLAKSVSHTVELKAGEFNTLTGKLNTLSPLSILRRGYSITVSVPGGEILKSAKGARSGDIIKTKLADGDILSEIKEVL